MGKQLRQRLSSNIYYDVLKDIPQLAFLFDEESIYLIDSEHYFIEGSCNNSLELTIGSKFGKEKIELVFNILSNRTFNIYLQEEQDSTTAKIIFNEDAISDLTEFVTALFDNTKTRESLIDNLETDALEALKGAFNNWNLIHNQQETKSEDKGLNKANKGKIKPEQKKK